MRHTQAKGHQQNVRGKRRIFQDKGNKRYSFLPLEQNDRDGGMDAASITECLQPQTDSASS
jgi:hypothetical protein